MALTAREACRTLITTIKTNAVCASCLKPFPPECLDFDHRDPATKKFNISSYSGPIWTLLEEIVKCQLKCANCHRLRGSVTIKAGIERARRSGKTLGRPKIVPNPVVGDLRLRGWSWRLIGEHLGMSRVTAYTHYKALLRRAA